MLYRFFMAGFAALAFLLMGALADPAAKANPIDCSGGDCTVSDNGASMTYDADSDWEMDTFIVGGMDHLYEEEYHACPDGCSNNDLNIELDNNFDLVSATEDEAANRILIVMEGSGLRLTFDHLLTDSSSGGVNMATIDETITIENIDPSGAPITLTLTEYDDFDLNDDWDNDIASYAGGNTFTQTSGNTTLTLTSTFFDSFDVAECCESEILEDHVVGNTLAGRTDFGPGDAAFALQYDLSVASGQAIVIEKQKTIRVVPEPASLALFSIGVAAIGYRRKRRGKRA
jgi:hypothetical protein